MTIQQFVITLTDLPRNAKCKPIVTRYTVAAESCDEALEHLRNECPSVIGYDTGVTVTPTLCRVMPTHAAY